MGELSLTPMMIRDYRVLVAPANADLGEALSTAFRFEGFFQRKLQDGENLFEVLGFARPHALVVDEDRLEGMSLAEFLAAVTREQRHTLVSLVMAKPNVELAFEAAKLGVRRVYSAPLNLEALVRQTGKDLVQSYGKSLPGGGTQRGYSSLTPREAEVAEMVAGGLTNRQMAKVLGISHRTVEVHRARILEKFQAKSTASFVRMYVEKRLAQ